MNPKELIDRVGRSQMRRRLGSERGNTFVEFALAAGVLFAMFAATFQYGYTFYMYDRLQSCVRSASRYASTKPFRSQSQSCIDNTITTIKNVAVYGSPTGGSTPRVRGLALSNISVVYTRDVSGIPQKVTVQVQNFTVNAIFNSFRLNNKPFAEVPFVGRYAPNECP